ncbi:MAG: dihydrolipoamide acetyltransferase family protein [Clostridia bacterium]|nr:dihydrolipoamide acetyltransferase family protein [Clostridia bacterium]
MIKQIIMPAAGQTTDVAVISRWCVKEGDEVKRGDVLLEAETDKAILPVESFASGTVLELCFAEGDEVSAGEVLARIGDATDASALAVAPETAPAGTTVTPPEEDDEYAPIIPAKAVSATKAEAVPTARQSVDRIGTPAMPGAKKLAREAGVDIDAIAPSNGKFVKAADVRAHVEGAGAEEGYSVMPTSTMRAVIGRRMLESARNIPAFALTVRIDMRAAMRLKELCLERRGLKISYNDILAKAIATAAKKFPVLNARYEEDEIRIYPHTNVGLAVGVDGGLLVPVVKRVDELTLDELAAANRRSIEAARAKSVLPEDMGCGSVTISNLGMFDVSEFQALINPPENCIFALGRIEKRPEWDGESFRPVPEMAATVSFDHRIYDGALGAEMLKYVKELMEHPELMLL